jgi:hypothetical protein
MDIKDFINAIKSEATNDRCKISLYVSESVFNDFRIRCGDVAPSRVLEWIMKESIKKSPQEHESRTS